MPTGRSVVATCTARAALAGNPSDGFRGAVLAVPVPDLVATVASSQADGFEVRTADPDLHVLLTATADAYTEAVGALPAVSISASTTIPRPVSIELAELASSVGSFAPTAVVGAFPRRIPPRHAA